MTISIPFGLNNINENSIQVNVPEGTEVLRGAGCECLTDPGAAIQKSLENPIGSRSFYDIASSKYRDGAKACVVVSDNTRPVPYKGENGILLPIIRSLKRIGYKKSDITVLIATGTHAAMSPDDIFNMLGQEVLDEGVTVINHDCKDEASLIHAGKTVRGTEVLIDKLYYRADLKILTGLVESHFMAGASGGRKSICPGIFGEKGTFVFHGPELMSDSGSRDLNIEGNPVHEESLAVAKIAGVDFIVNVTLDAEFRITGVFSGDLEKAHEAAVQKIKSYVGIPFEKPYDMIITHAGFVGRNHYQAAKAAVEASYAIKEGGHVIMAADNHDKNPIGHDRYLACCALLKQIGPFDYEKLLKSEGWTFIPDQWQVQMWTKLFKKTGMDHFIYYAPQLTDDLWRSLPGVNGKKYLEDPNMGAAEGVKSVVENAIKDILSKENVQNEDIASGKYRIAFLAEGPYAVPIKTVKRV